MEKLPLTDKKFVPTFIFVTSLFMLWGIAISMGDVLNRHFQKVLSVSLAQSGLVQFSIFGAYFIMGIPAGLFMKRYGYKNGVLLGLCLYALGAFLFVPAAGQPQMAMGALPKETFVKAFKDVLGVEK